MISEWRF